MSNIDLRKDFWSIWVAYLSEWKRLLSTWIANVKVIQGTLSLPFQEESLDWLHSYACKCKHSFLKVQTWYNQLMLCLIFNFWNVHLVEQWKRKQWWNNFVSNMTASSALHSVKAASVVSVAYAFICIVKKWFKGKFWTYCMCILLWIHVCSVKRIEALKGAIWISG